MRELDAAAIGGLETAVNAFLDQSPMVREKLNRLAGKRLGIKVLPQDWYLQLLFSDGEILLLTEPGNADDALIQGKMADLLQLLYQPRKVLFGQGIALEGDAAMVQRIQKALGDAELDWEAWLGDQLGDLSAGVLISSSHKLSQWIQSSNTDLRLSMKDYLQDEIRILPSRIEFEYWADEIGRLENRIEILSRRLQSLNSERLNNNQNQNGNKDK